MRVNPRASSYVSLAAILLSCVPTPASSGELETSSIIEIETAPTLPIKIYRNFLIAVEGQFGSSPAPQTFILDTGTSPTIINPRLVRQFGLKTVPTSITAVGKSVPALIASAPEIRIGPIRAASVPVIVQDLALLERDLGVPVAGIVGFDVLSRAGFHLDYDKEEIEFGRIEKRGIPVWVNDRNNLAVAQVEIQGKPMRLIIDSGTDRLVLFGGNFPKVDWLALRATSQTGASLTEQAMRVQVFSAPDIAMGGYHFSKDRAYVVPAGSDADFDGSLGVRALGFRGFSYDQESRTIYLQ